jgi:hypothetical protein
MYPVLQCKEGQRFIQIFFLQAVVNVDILEKGILFLSVPKFVCKSKGKISSKEKILLVNL